MPTTITHGARRAAVYNPTDGTVTQLNALVANEFRFEQREYDHGETDPTGGRDYRADDSLLHFTFLDPTGERYRQLRQWQKAGARVSAVVEGAHRNVQWYERDRISLLRPAPLLGMAQGRADVYEFEMVRKGHGTHDIHSQTNLLAHLPGPFGGEYQEEIIFPLAGPRFTLAATAIDGNIKLDILDVSGSFLLNLNTATGDGRKAISLVAPAQTFSIRSAVDHGTDVEDVSLRVDGSGEYTAH